MNTCKIVKEITKKMSQAYGKSFARVYNEMWGTFARIHDLNMNIKDPEKEDRIFIVARK